MGALQAEDHKSTAGIGNPEKEVRLKDVVLSIRPARHTTWDSFYDTNCGIE